MYNLIKNQKTKKQTKTNRKLLFSPLIRFNYSHERRKLTDKLLSPTPWHAFTSLPSCTSGLLTHQFHVKSLAFFIKFPFSASWLSHHLESNLVYIACVPAIYSSQTTCGLCTHVHQNVTLYKVHSNSTSSRKVLFSVLISTFVLSSLIFPPPPYEKTQPGAIHMTFHHHIIHLHTFEPSL